MGIKMIDFGIIADRAYIAAVCHVGDCGGISSVDF